ncbi:hypothetical protein [Micromonospora palythoicola]|uniref:hypothetical protein n=1 Tax=Micromonospora palythoicola TaxID=3120507 RepID=UPI002FCE216A
MAITIKQHLADTIDANHLVLGLHGFAVSVNSTDWREPATTTSPTIYIWGVQMMTQDKDGSLVPAGYDTVTDNGKMRGVARVRIATPAGQVLPADLFRQELERIIGKPQRNFYPGGGFNMQYVEGSPWVESAVVSVVDGQTDLVVSMGDIPGQAA